MIFAGRLYRIISYVRCIKGEGHQKVEWNVRLVKEVSKNEVRNAVNKMESRKTVGQGNCLWWCGMHREKMELGKWFCREF